MSAIRPYRQEDKRRVQEICLRTANDNNPFTCIEEHVGRNYLLPLYCDYYIEREPESCFVVTDENDAAVGYIMCAKKHGVFSRVFLKEYITRLCDSTAWQRIEAVGEVFMHGLFKLKYPAHLHIDILKGYRGGGNGTAMMNTLLDHLKANNIKGVHLIVSSSNTGAISFYKHCGFKVVLSFGKGKVMGKKL